MEFTVKKPTDPADGQDSAALESARSLPAGATGGAVAARAAGTANAMSAAGIPSPFPRGAAADYQLYKEVEALLQDRCLQQEAEILRLREREDALTMQYVSIQNTHRTLKEGDLPAVLNREKELRGRCAELETALREARAQRERDFQAASAERERERAEARRQSDVAAELTVSRSELALKLEYAQAAREESERKAALAESVARDAQAQTQIVESARATTERSLEQARAELHRLRATIAADRTEQKSRHAQWELERADWQEERTAYAVALEGGMSERARLESEKSALSETIDELQRAHAATAAQASQTIADLELRLQESEAKLRREAHAGELDRREAGIAAYTALQNDRAQALRRIVHETAAQIEGIAAINPIKDYLGLTERELARVAGELKRLPASDAARPQLELMCHRLEGQRDYLSEMLRTSQSELEKRAKAILELAVTEKLEPIPPMFQVRVPGLCRKRAP